MIAVKYLRDMAVFAPCYLLLDWTSYIDPVGPFNITPWNPQPALAIVWMMLGGLGNVPAVFGTIVVADIVVRDVPGGYAITFATALILATGYAAMAWALRYLLHGAGLHSIRELTIFAALAVAATGIVGSAFVGVLGATGLLGDTAFLIAWTRFWVGDAVGILVTAPLLLAAADPTRRSGLLALARRPEAVMQALVLAATVWLIFKGLTGDPARHFYLLFLPLIWIAVRFGMNGAVVATGIVQVGVVLGIHGDQPHPLSIVDLQALVAALTLTGLFLGIMVDERQRAEESMRQTLRLAAAGEMAGAIAHEVNQPLTALANYGRSAQVLLARPAGESAQVQEIIGKMMLETDRAADIVRRLRDFFRAGTTRLEEVKIGELLAAACHVGESLVGGRSISLEIASEEGLRVLYVDRLQIELILRNLLTNAVDSLIAAGRKDGRIRINAYQHDENRVRIVVTDNGPGVPDARREGLFEPFVSGKPTGMGLGLAISRAIAEAHGGSLEARSADHGEFHLVLPCVQSV